MPTASRYVHTSPGFTLIELLVVISIIGLLSTLAVVALSSARAKTRDTKRLADIKQLQTTLDLYYEKYGSYPVSGSCNATIPNGGWCNSVESLASGHWLRNGATTLDEFIKLDPLDPKQATIVAWLPNNGGPYYYFASGYGGTGQWYMLVFGLEDTSHTYQNQDGVRACDGTQFHYGNGSDGIITVGRNCQR